MRRLPLLQTGNAWRVCTLALLLALGFAARLLGANVITGDVTPALPWSSLTTSEIGITGIGMLTVDGGSQLSSGLSYLGFNSGSMGAATITGAGSKWTNSSELKVGYNGSGSLHVEAGGEVSNFGGYLGYNAGSTGTATITGAGSKWTNSSELKVGDDGSGSLTVEDGGQVTAATLYASLGDLHGNGTIVATKGAVLDADLQFSAAHPAQNVLSFGAGGALTVTQAGGDLGAGYVGPGSLTISEGVAVSSFNGYLGYNAGSTGTATITGAGSKWTHSTLHVGRSGSGTLRVEAGGQVGSAGGYLGSSAGSTGAATITGAGSKWTSSHELYVGRLGSGSLTVEDGGQVTVETLYASLGDLHGNGTIVATKGAVLDADLQFNAAQPAQNVLSFGADGTLTVTAGGRTLGAGYKGRGKLTISEGVAMSSSDGYLGYHAGSAGAATITGALSKWINSSQLYVGNYGSGTLRVEVGGQVSNFSGFLGYHTGSTGTATITGAGSKWANSAGLVVGDRGNGALRVEAGGVVTSANGDVGDNNGSTGAATITGAGSKWTNSTLYVGRSGSGTLRVEAGGQVSDESGYLGWYPLARGAATVTGAGSKWTNRAALYVGYSGDGALTIIAGGLVSVRETLTIDSNGGGDSFINLAAGGMLALWGDADDSLAQFLGLVSGTDAIRYWNASSANWAPLTAATLGVDYTLRYQAGGDLTGYTLLTVLAPGPAGDFNFDGRVDGADLLAWQRGESPLPNSPEDLAIWRTNFSLGASMPALTSLPEPETFALVGLASTFLLLGCRRLHFRQRVGAVWESTGPDADVAQHTDRFAICDLQALLCALGRDTSTLPSHLSLRAEVKST